MSATSQSVPVSEQASGNSSQAQQPNIPTASIPISDAGKKAKKKLLQLRDGATMTVKDISPSSSGEMIVRVSFNFVKDNRFDQMAAFKLSDIGHRKAWDSLCVQLNQCFFVDVDCNHVKAMSNFLYQQITEFESRRPPNNTSKKPYLEFTVPTVIQSGKDCYYLVAGKDKVFRLNQSGLLSQECRAEEISELGFQIHYTGKAKVEYVADDEAAVKVVMNILECLNGCQNPDQYSAPFGVMVALLRTLVYVPALEDGHQNDWYTSITYSGPHTETGKSLFTNVWQQLIYGEKSTPKNHITEPKVAERLAGRTPIFVEELRNMGVVKSVVQKVWERSSWDTRVAEQVPNTVFHFCLNNFPEDFKESGSGSRHWGTILDKTSWIFTGIEKLHERNGGRKLRIRAIELATQGHKFLPSLAGIAVRTCMKRVTTEELASLNEELQASFSEREGQPLKDYKATYDFFQNYCLDTNLECTAPLFNQLGTDMRCLLASKQLPMSAEDINTSVIKVIEHLVSSNKIPLLQEGYFKKRSGFRIKVGDIKNEPKEFATALRNCTEEDSRGGIRYRFLVKNLLNEDTKEIIEKATSALDIWIKMVETLKLSEERVEMSRFEKKLYYSITEEEIERVTDPEHVQDLDLAKEQSHEFGEKTDSSQVQQILEGRSTRTFIPRTCGLSSCGDHIFKTKQVLDKHRQRPSHKRAEAMSEVENSKSKKRREEGN